MKTASAVSSANGISQSVDSSHVVSRRAAREATFAAVGLSALTFEPVRAAEATKRDARRGSPKRYDMLKSIDLWAFPYPDRMSLRECLQLAKDAGFDGIEVNCRSESAGLTKGRGQLIVPTFICPADCPASFVSRPDGTVLDRGGAAHLNLSLE